MQTICIIWQSFVKIGPRISENQWRREGICRPGQTSVLPPPPPSGVFTNLKRYISGVQFQKFSNFIIFFTVNISTIFLHPKVPRRRGSPLDTPLAPPIRSAVDILMAMVWTVNSTLSWGVYKCLTQWNLGVRPKLINCNCQKN